MDNDLSAATRLLLGGALAATALPCLAADESEEALDGDFLDYLGTLEGEQEDWTWFSGDESKQIEQAPPASEDAGKDAHR